MGSTPSAGENITASFRLITRWMSAAIVERFTSLYSLSRSTCMHGMKYHFSILISNKVSQTSKIMLRRKAEIMLLRGSKTTTENNNWAVSVYDEKRYFRKNTQTTLTCSVVTLAYLVAFWSSLSAKRQFRIIAHPRVISLKLALNFSPVLGVEPVGAV